MKKDKTYSIEEQAKIDSWNNLSINEREALLKRWEIEDAYPYGVSNSKKRFDKISSHYVIKAIIGNTF